LLLSRFDHHIPKDLPAGVRHFDYVPFTRLLPRAAAIVHHGGIGTCAQGLHAGIPQLVMPMSVDQPDNALRLLRLGVADRIHAQRFRGPEVARRLERLLSSPQVAHSCATAAARFAGIDPFAEACRVLEDYAARRGLPAGQSARASSLPG
jgi:UDP:flavonoid glycosyltransferase YjiC (YdhE family)